MPYVAITQFGEYLIKLSYTTISRVTERLLREDETSITRLIIHVIHDIMVLKNVISTVSQQYKRIDLVDSFFQIGKILKKICKVFQIAYVFLYIFLKVDTPECGVNGCS